MTWTKQARALFESWPCRLSKLKMNKGKLPLLDAFRNPTESFRTEILEIGVLLKKSEEELMLQAS